MLFAQRALSAFVAQGLAHEIKEYLKSKNMDHWFKFMLRVLIYMPAYKLAASELLKTYNAQAELTFNDMQESINVGVACIHLEKV